MKKTFDLEDAPLYVRWTPESVPVLLELRLDVVSRIEKEMEQSSAAGLEVGGLLTGRMIPGIPSVLRIDDVVMFPRKPEDGPIFMLDPGEHDRFLTTRWDLKTEGQSALGLFRTHLRSGSMRLSLADRSLISDHFAKDAAVVMLVQGKPPRRAALFVSTGTALPEQPTVPEFIFDETQLRALPEENHSIPSAKRGSWSFLLWAALTALVLAVAGAIYQSWDNLQSAFGAGAAGPSLHLAGSSLVTVTWNHGASQIRKATSGRLTVEDGELHRELSLGPDELRLGSVEYDPQTNSVSVTLTLSMVDSTTVSQSATWQGS